MKSSEDNRKRAKAAGIKDIATALGVSIGTVDRALHQRPGINPMTRTRVLKMAQTLGYRPNVAARNLRLDKKLSISVHLPEEIASFFDALREGIEEAAVPFQDSVELQFRTYPRLGEGDTELFAEALEDKTNGIILAPGHPADLKPWIRKAARSHVPVVCVATDAPGTERLTAVSIDSYSSGATVAELLARCAQKAGDLLVITGDLSTVDHSEKVRGVREFLTKMKSSLILAGVVETHDDPERTYAMVKDALAARKNLAAVYVSTANSLPVLQAMEDAGRVTGTLVITTDLFPRLIPLIRNGNVLATIYQRPRAQGRMAFRSMYQFLVEGTCPPLRQRLPAHIILQSNLDLFLEMQTADMEGVASSS
ncbi:MAG: LacI family DNA-binding transcriptional regulator [Acidobacteriota bacterium]|nr:LacI family DNA-binding transcriptional regulator [Acidobacteriota bacterium]